MVQGANPLSETVKPVGVGVARRHELLSLAVVEFSPLEKGIQELQPYDAR